MSKTSFRMVPPSNTVIAVLPDQASVDQLLVALTQAHYGDDKVEVMHGQAGLDTVDPDGTAHGMWTRMLRDFQKFTTGVEDRVLTAVQKALEDDKYLVVVSTDGSEEQIQEVLALLRAHGGTSIFFFGYTGYRLIDGW